MYEWKKTVEGGLKQWLSKLVLLGWVKRYSGGLNSKKQIEIGGSGMWRHENTFQLHLPLYFWNLCEDLQYFSPSNYIQHSLPWKLGFGGAPSFGGQTHFDIMPFLRKKGLTTISLGLYVRMCHNLKRDMQFLDWENWHALGSMGRACRD